MYECCFCNWLNLLSLPIYDGRQLTFDVCVPNWLTHSSSWPTNIQRMHTDLQRLCSKLTHSSSFRPTDIRGMPTDIQRLCSKLTDSTIVKAYRYTQDENWYTTVVLKIYQITHRVGLLINDGWILIYVSSVLNLPTRPSFWPTDKCRLFSKLAH